MSFTHRRIPVLVTAHQWFPGTDLPKEIAEITYLLDEKGTCKSCGLPMKNEHLGVLGTAFYACSTDWLVLSKEGETDVICDGEFRRIFENYNISAQKHARLSPLAEAWSILDIFKLNGVFCTERSYQEAWDRTRALLQLSVNFPPPKVSIAEDAQGIDMSESDGLSPENTN